MISVKNEWILKKIAGLGGTYSQWAILTSTCQFQLEMPMQIITDNKGLTPEDSLGMILKVKSSSDILSLQRILISLHQYPKTWRA